LMLDEKDSSLYKYISEHILSPLGLEVEQITAFNLISLSLNTSLAAVARARRISLNDLVGQLAEFTYGDIREKLDKYKPDYMVTLGNPVFEFLKKKAGVITLPIRESFAVGYKMVLDSHPIICLPCVHMRTYNVYRKVYKDQDNRLRKWALNQQI